MVTVNITVTDEAVQPGIYLGRQGEKQAREIVLDLSAMREKYGAGTATLYHQRSKDPAPYLIGETTGTTLTWTVSETDTVYAGIGYCEVRYTFGTEGLSKSAMFATNVKASLSGDVIIPAATQAWYDALIDYVDEHCIAREQLAQAVADYIEAHPLEGLPSGGTEGQVLVKNSGTDFDAEWSDNLSDLKSALNTKAHTIYSTASGAIASFDDGADSMPVKALTVNIEPVQSGSGDPSPDNVRPISGWTETTVTRTGKNLIENTGGSKTINGITFTMNDDGTVTANGTATAQVQYFVFGSPVSSPANKKFAEDVITSTEQIGSATTYRGIVWTADSAGEERNYFIDEADKTVPANSIIKGFAIRIMNGITVNNVVFKPMIRLAAETDSTYEPYQGNTYTIQLGETVYGGTLDVTTGVLTVDRGIYKVAKANGYDSSGKVINFGTISDVVSSGSIDVTKYKCVALSAVTNIAAVRNDANDNVFTVLTGTIWAKSSAWSSVSDAQAFINNNDVNITYPLATPFTVQLTAEEVTTLLGQNNIWADCGDATVEYSADTKLYIEKINAPTDDDMTANTQIESGKYFLIGNTLYKSTTVIPAGDTIIPGTNCTKTNLAEALNALNI